MSIIRLIDANALIRSIEEIYCKPCKEQGNDYHGIHCRACGYGDVIDDIDDAPTYVKEDPRESD